jgi:hypothetical protein
MTVGWAISIAASLALPAITAGSALWQDTNDQPKLVHVRTERLWSDSGLTVTEGDQLAFCATGKIRITWENHVAGPAGIADGGDPRGLTVATLPVGALIGSVDGVSFPIGGVTKLIKMPDAPHVIGDARFHRRGHAERLMGAGWSSLKADPASR